MNKELEKPQDGEEKGQDFDQGSFWEKNCSAPPF